MIKLFFITAFAYLTSIYSFQITDINNNTINFNDFQGKKLLLVNIATGSTRVSQLSQLEQLNQKYGDSLVIIAFPSNSFGHESRTNSEIKQFCQSQYGITFRLIGKTSVNGGPIHPVYNWLTHQSENGTFNNVVYDDFQKFLIDKNGSLIGVFNSKVLPTDPLIINAITNL